MCSDPWPGEMVIAYATTRIERAVTLLGILKSDPGLPRGRDLLR